MSSCAYQQHTKVVRMRSCDNMSVIEILMEVELMMIMKSLLMPFLF